MIKGSNLVEFVFALFGIVDGWVVAVLSEMTGCHETIAAYSFVSLELPFSK